MISSLLFIYYFSRGLHSPLLIEFHPRNLSDVPEFINKSRNFRLISDSLSHVCSSICELRHKTLMMGTFLFKVLSRPNRVSLSVLPQVLSLLLPPLALEVTLSKGLHQLFTAKKHGIHCEPWPTVRASLFHKLQVRYVFGFRMVQ